MKEKFVYFFANGKAEGTAKMKDLLGGKGANLAEMTNLGVPVPPGFTISTDACRIYYSSKGKIPRQIISDYKERIRRQFKSAACFCEIRSKIFHAGNDGYYFEPWVK